MTTRSLRIIKTLVATGLLLMAAALAGCAGPDQPLPLGDRASPTPTPTDEERARAAALATPTPTQAPLPTSVPVATPTSAPLATPTVIPSPTPQPPQPTAAAAAEPTAAPSGQQTAPAAPTVIPSPTPQPPQPTATVAAAPTQAPAAGISPTHTPVPIPADYNRSVEGPPSEELIKFAQWDENRVKLANWVAGYIIAHGLDHPVRVVEMNADDYKEGLPHSDIDIVMEADPQWAKPYADAGVFVLLGPLSGASGETVIAVNASVWRRAPNVGQFLEKYEWNSDDLTSESAKITRGRIAVRENTIGIEYVKNSRAWTQWIDASVVTAVETAMEDGKVSHCRRVEERQSTGSAVRVCVDDPSKSVCLGCQ